MGKRFLCDICAAFKVNFDKYFKEQFNFSII